MNEPFHTKIKEAFEAVKAAVAVNGLYNLKKYKIANAHSLLSPHMSERVQLFIYLGSQTKPIQRSLEPWYFGSHKFYLSRCN